MEMRNKESTQQVLTMLQAVYDYMLKKSDEDLTAFNKAFCLICDDIDPELLRAAALQWMSENRPFHPKPGELRQLANEIKRKAVDAAEGREQIDAALAWQQLTRWLVLDARGGAEWLPGYESRVHPLAITAIERFGMRRFVNRQEEDEPIDSSQFRNIFEQVRDMKREPGLFHPLVSSALQPLIERWDVKRLTNGQQ